MLTDPRPAASRGDGGYQRVPELRTLIRGDPPVGCCSSGHCIECRWPSLWRLQLAHLPGPLHVSPVIASILVRRCAGDKVSSATHSHCSHSRSLKTVGFFFLSLHICEGLFPPVCSCISKTVSFIKEQFQLKSYLCIPQSVIQRCLT